MAQGDIKGKRQIKKSFIALTIVTTHLDIQKKNVSSNMKSRSKLVNPTNVNPPAARAPNIFSPSTIPKPRADNAHHHNHHTTLLPTNLTYTSTSNPPLTQPPTQWIGRPDNRLQNEQNLHHHGARASTPPAAARGAESRGARWGWGTGPSAGTGDAGAAGAAAVAAADVYDGGAVAGFN